MNLHFTTVVDFFGPFAVHLLYEEQVPRNKLQVGRVYHDTHGQVR